MVTSARYRRQVKYFLMKKCWKSLKQLCRVRRNEVDPRGGISVVSGAELE